jgi:hypothetical protein
MRWLEERVSFKNREIAKTPIPVADLPRFELGVNDVGRASLDVLRLDAHVRVTDWISQRLVATEERVAAGITLPVTNVRKAADGNLIGDISLVDYDADEDVLRAYWSEGAFVRLTVHNGDPARGQTLGQLRRAGVTARLDTVDWEAGTVRLSPIPGVGSRYVFPSASADWASDAMEWATLDESPSDFVAGRVESRLLAVPDAPTIQWFDPLSPSVPEAPSIERETLAALCAAVNATATGSDLSLHATQVEAVLRGLQARVDLLQGPPGTGKTTTTALAILARVALRREPGQIILVGANTHTAVNELLRRVAETRAAFAAVANQGALRVPPVRVVRVDADESGASSADVEIRSTGCIRQLRGLARDGVLIVGGTTNGLLKLAKTLAHRFTFSELVVDEASMMVFPHFLALTTLIGADGYVMLAGDHRQLAPILAHDWEREDRPPVVAYQAHTSAFDAVANLAEGDGISSRSIGRSGLSLTFRLPPRVVDLIRGVYAHDNITLSSARTAEATTYDFTDPWSGLWSGDHGVFLVVHDERQSRKANRLEVEIIRRVCDGAPAPLAANTAIVTPHRAQRQLLREELADRVGLIDTVERLQGGERDVVIVSGCASDPAAIGASAAFILDLNRANVAFSRVRHRMIVICAQTLLDHIPSEIELYDDAALWKALRDLCTEHCAVTEVSGYRVRILTPPVLDSLSEIPA